MVMAKSLTHCNIVAYKQPWGNIALLSSKIIMTQTARLNHSDEMSKKTIQNSLLEYLMQT